MITAYLLGSTTIIPISGKLSDQFGLKPFLLASVALFLLGSALSGMAQSMDQLIAFRVIQGMGAGSCHQTMRTNNDPATWEADNENQSVLKLFLFSPAGYTS